VVGSGTHPLINFEKDRTLHVAERALGYIRRRSLPIVLAGPHARSLRICSAFRNESRPLGLVSVQPMEEIMGRGILLWLLGVPIPIIILLALIWH
jgi:hypothetical protein